MKTIRVYLLPMMLTLALCLASCSNDYEIWDDVNETETWEFELQNIMSDLDFLFENSSIKFLHAEELYCKVDSTDFFNDETYYPVCFKNLYNFIALRKQAFVMNDTNTIHMPAPAMKGLTSYIVNNQDKFDFVKLRWIYCEKEFETVAVFNKSNGEIVYDNILTNIPLFQMELPATRSKLTRSEGSVGEVETRIFYKDRLTVNHLGYYFDYRIKGLCKVMCYPSGVCSLMYYETIVDQLTHSPYEEGMFYPVADVLIHNGNIYYYLWLGVGTNDYPLYYNSDNPGVNAYNLWMDKHEYHIWGDNKCKIERAGFYYNLNSGLYAPDSGWNF